LLSSGLKNLSADHEKSISVKKMDVKKQSIKFSWESVFCRKILQGKRKNDRLPLHDNFREMFKDIPHPPRLRSVKPASGKMGAEVSLR
jgi:hypothetical protein